MKTRFQSSVEACLENFLDCPHTVHVHQTLFRSSKTEAIDARVIRHGNTARAEFAGEPTEHIIIPFGKGICGQVAVSNENFVVPDVESQDNYISCGWKVKSEIVVPIFLIKKNIGQIDIDSHEVDPFSRADEELLEFVCEKVAEILN